jgi:hypothetical protein
MICIILFYSIIIYFRSLMAIETESAASKDWTDWRKGVDNQLDGLRAGMNNVVNGIQTLHSELNQLRDDVKDIRFRAADLGIVNRLRNELEFRLSGTTILSAQTFKRFQKLIDQLKSQGINIDPKLLE